MWAAFIPTVFSLLRFVSSFRTNIYILKLSIYFSCVAPFVIYLKRKFYFLYVDFTFTVLPILSFVSLFEMNKSNIMCFKNFVYLEDFYSFCTDIISPRTVCWFIHLNLRDISWCFSPYSEDVKGYLNLNLKSDGKFHYEDD